MISLENPAALLLLLVLSPILLLGVWGFSRFKNILTLIKVDNRKFIRRYVLKYGIFAALMTLGVIALAEPRLNGANQTHSNKTGEVIFLVDVSPSMAARKNINGPTRLTRAEIIVTRALLQWPGAEMTVCGFTHTARCFAPLTRDHAYLQRTLDRVLDISSVPGIGTSIGGGLMGIVSKFSSSAEPKIVVVLSDGENFWSSDENDLVASALNILRQKGVKIFAVGVGEKEGALIPLYDRQGVFTGKYAEQLGSQYTTRLDETILRQVADKYFNEDQSGELLSYIDDNLRTALVSSQESSRDITFFLIIPMAILWILFARNHLR